MKISEAILSFSQSEKIKSGLIWATHLLEAREAISPERRGGADQTVETLLGMIGYETQVIRNITKDKIWEEAEISINMALVMIRSNIPEESGYHLTNALTRVTSIGQRAMIALKEKDLL
jgi:hypothetical protein